MQFNFDIFIHMVMRSSFKSTMLSFGNDIICYPAAPAAPFAVEFWSYFFVFKIYYKSRGSDKPVCGPVCHGGAKVRYVYPRSITIISTFCCGLLGSSAVSCVLTTCFFRSVSFFVCLYIRISPGLN